MLSYNNLNIKNNLVSVIMSAYNHENYVQEAIKSIINQTYKNIELLIIDDGSRDNTWQKIKKMEEECRERFLNIYFETKENEGVCTTFNKLISMAKGEYIQFIASDDVAKPNMIETYIDFLSNNKDYVLAICDDELIDNNSKIVGVDETRNITDIKNARFKSFAEYLKYCRKDINFNSDEFGSYSNLLKNNYLPTGAMVRKNVLLDSVYPFTKEAPLEDFYMLLQLSKVGKFKFIDKMLYSYRIHNNNTSKNIEHMEDMTTKTLQYEEKLVNKAGNEHWKKIFYSYLTYDKIRLNLLLFKIYKKRNFLEKKIIYTLKIFNKEFTIKSRNF